MKVIYDIKHIGKRFKPTAVTVGVFDGVHIGHKKIIENLTGRAIKNRLQATVVTFNPHPNKALKGDSAVSMLSSLQHRISLIRSLGVDICVILNFNKGLSGKKADYFFKSILIDKFHMRELVIGGKFSFGKERLHDERCLKEMADYLNFKLKIIKPMLYKGNIISSTMIRRLVEDGRLETASRLLGRRVSVLGTVIHGRKRGRIIGFKTANIDPHHEAIPPGGVYAVYARLNNKIYKAVLNIGRRPTFDEKEHSVEVYIFGINKDLYGKDIEVYFIKRLRPEKRFKNEQALRNQILNDVEIAKIVLKSTPLKYS